MLCFHNENWGLVVHMSFKGQKKVRNSFSTPAWLHLFNSWKFISLFLLFRRQLIFIMQQVNRNFWKQLVKCRKTIYLHFPMKKTSLKNIKTSNQLDYYPSCFEKTPSIICVRSRRNLTVVLITNKPYKAFLIYF